MPEHEHRPHGQPGGPATSSRRVARFGQPVSPLGRGVATLCALAASLGAAAWLASEVWDRRTLVADLGAGLPVSDEMLAAADDRVASAGVALAIAMVITAIALLTWMPRAYRNVGAWRAIDYGVGWSVVGWFVPIVNLLRPAKIMVEIVEGSPTTGRGSGLAWWWWITWLLTGAGGAVVGIIDVGTTDDFVAREALMLAATALLAVAAVMLMVIVGRATNDQRLHIARAAEMAALAEASAADETATPAGIVQPAGMETSPAPRR